MELDKIAFAVSMIVTNVANKHVRDDLDALQRVILHEEVCRKLFWICLFFIATRDFMVSFFGGLCMGFVTEFFHDHKRFFLFNPNGRCSAYRNNKALAHSISNKLS
jgi:hypothetical protein